ncbi:AraC family transcriptional regulator [uncultured Polaribacter sp.]|uniref:helix-turn-helix domain-containing protein n=1 Tax=uncultured Polaribacter sp. TaxID=174711 RepID=UPI002639AAE5|nr:AraC family transcriptional regulator [uncultured Polaribacter sp.]
MLNRVQHKIGDPSTNQQTFTDVELKTLCCRYWLLDTWDCHDLAFPFWRIYWNKNDGGVLQLNQTIHEMTPDKVYIIPPFTSFSTYFKKNKKHHKGFQVTGRHLTTEDDDTELAKTSLLHVFIHFNLGVPFDNVYPGIFMVEVSDSLKEKFDYLTERLKQENTYFYVTYTLRLQALIKEILSNIGPELFKTLNVDQRILKVVRYIENNIDQNLSNSSLADIANMATNSFSRLFKQKMNITLHNFIMKRKISRSCKLLMHTNKTIKEVSYSLGFSDRHHFSRVFKLVTGITPSVYKSGNFS